MSRSQGKKKRALASPHCNNCQSQWCRSFVGSKRKAASLQEDEQINEQIGTNGDDSINLAIDREIEREIAEIKAGRHPNLTASVESLERAKQRKIEASDRHRKMQMNNINALYEYEVEDAHALFKVSSCCSVPPNFKLAATQQCMYRSKHKLPVIYHLYCFNNRKRTWRYKRS